MPVIQAESGLQLPVAVALSTAQTGTGDSTNTLDREGLTGPGGIIITSTVGATPTVTVNILGSLDGVNFFNVEYALQGSPSTLTQAAIVITTAVTSTYLLPAAKAWRFLKLALSANTNVTLTATAIAAVS